MGLDLERREFKNYRGETVQVPDFQRSRKWAHAAQEAGVSRDDYNAYAKYYEDHPYIRSLYQTVKPGTQTSYGYGVNATTSQQDGYAWYFTGETQQNDPFAGARVAQLAKTRDNFKVEGDRASYTETRLARDAIRIRGALNPLTGRQEQIIRPDDARYNDIYQKAIAQQSEQQPSNKGTPNPWGNPNARRRTQYESVTGRTETVTRSGRVLNGAFVDDNLYNALDEQQRQYYGLNFAEAYAADPGLNNAARVIDAAHNYRRARNLKSAGPSLPTAQAGSRRRNLGAGFPSTVSRGTLGQNITTRRGDNEDELRTRRTASGRRTTVISGANALA